MVMDSSRMHLYSAPGAAMYLSSALLSLMARGLGVISNEVRAPYACLARASQGLHSEVWAVATN
jgi:hypothetical protein